MASMRCFYRWYTFWVYNSMQSWWEFVVVLTLYHTILTLNDLENEAF